MDKYQYYLVIPKINRKYFTESIVHIEKHITFECQTKQNAKAMKSDSGILTAIVFYDGGSESQTIDVPYEWEQISFDQFNAWIPPFDFSCNGMQPDDLFTDLSEAIREQCEFEGYLNQLFIDNEPKQKPLEIKVEKDYIGWYAYDKNRGMDFSYENEGWKNTGSPIGTGGNIADAIESFLESFDVEPRFTWS